MTKTLKMNDGRLIPQLGFGVYQSPRGSATYEAVIQAFRAGYRHIDTAAIYGNEADVGRAVRESGLKREEVFVTTKLWNSDQGYDSVLEAFEKSLAALRLDYVDLYLIHFPVTSTRLKSWRALEAIRDSKRARSIGVSNYTIAHLKELHREFGVWPSVNQVELSPFLYQKELLDFCRSNGILLEAYSPLTRGKRLGDPVVREIAAHHKKTPAQILIRWCIEHGTIPLPKSNTHERIQENAQVFDFALSAEELARLDSLNEGFRVSWDPSDVP